MVPNMVVSQNKGTPIQTQNTIVLIVGTPKKVTLILGNLHVEQDYILLWDPSGYSMLCGEDNLTGFNHKCPLSWKLQKKPSTIFAVIPFKPLGNFYAILSGFMVESLGLRTLGLASVV